ncbi:MAG TPA: polysaccharide biosynthesis C-terminal domain-containing protein [Polyangiales bacterium]
MSSREPLAGSVVGTGLRQALAALVQLGSVVLIARLLGVDGNGMYASALLLPGLLTTILVLGLPASAVYFLAPDHAPRQAVLAVLQRLALRLCVAGLAIGAVFVGWLAPSLLPGVPRTAQWIALSTFPTSFASALLLSVLQAEGRFREYNRLALAGPVLTLTLVGAAALADLRSPAFMVAAAAGAQACVVFVQWHAVVRGRRRAVASEFAGDAPELQRQIVRYGVRAHAANVVAHLNYRADMYFIALLSGNVAMGLYALAVQFSERLFIVSQAGSTVLLPVLTSLADQPERARELAAFAARWSLLATVAAAFSLYVALQVLTPILFGAQYVGAGPLLAILFAGAAITGLSRILANAVAAAGKPAANAWAAALGACFNVLLCVTLVPSFGAVGAAIASLVGFAVQAAVTVVAWCQLTGAGLRDLVDPRGDLARLRELRAR